MGWLVVSWWKRSQGARPCVSVHACSSGCAASPCRRQWPYRSPIMTCHEWSWKKIVRVAEGPDARTRRVVDARLPPYAAVGRLSGSMVCTVALVVHPRIAVTAAHCVTSGNGLISLLPPIYASGYQAGGEIGHFKALVWAIGAQQDFKGQSAHDASNDWAVLLLEGAPAGIRPFLLSDPPADTLMALGSQVEMPSYAIDVGEGQVLSLDPACSIRKHAWNVLVHDCKTVCIWLPISDMSSHEAPPGSQRSRPCERFNQRSWHPPTCTGLKLGHRAGMSTRR